MDITDFNNYLIEWTEAGEPKTMVEWLQEDKLSRRLSPSELMDFIRISVKVFS